MLVVYSHYWVSIKHAHRMNSHIIVVHVGVFTVIRFLVGNKRKVQRIKTRLWLRTLLFRNGNATNKFVRCVKSYNHMCNFFLARKLPFVDFPYDHDSIDCVSYYYLILTPRHIYGYFTSFSVPIAIPTRFFHTEFIGFTKREHIHSAHTSIANTRIQYSRLNGATLHHAALIVSTRWLLPVKNHRNTYIHMILLDGLDIISQMSDLVSPTAATPKR